jgi:hypothetical protein
MSQKYTKFGSEYEDDYWRKLADRQAFNRKVIVFGIIAVISIGLLFYKYPEQIAKLEIKKFFAKSPFFDHCRVQDNSTYFFSVI